MWERRRWLQVLATLVMIALASARETAAAEPDATEPAVCAPPCPAGQTCIGHACVTEDGRPAPPPVRAGQPHPATPPAPTSATFLGSPQPAPGPATPPPSAAAPAPTLTHDQPPAPGPGLRSQAGGQPPQPAGYRRTPDAVDAHAPQQWRKRRILALPYLGIHSYQNREASAYDPGARFGALLGGRFGDVASVSLELSVNLSNVHGIPSGTTFSEQAYALALSPLFEFPAGPIEIALGPKLGVLAVQTKASGSGAAVSRDQSGFVAGVNAGFFVPATPQTSFGVLLSFELFWADHQCEDTACPLIAGANSAKVVGLTGAALF